MIILRMKRVWERRIRFGHAVQFSRSVVSNCLQPHELQHTRLPCPSPSLRICSTSSPLIGEAIQPSHSLSSPYPFAFNLSQHQGKYWSFSFSISPSSEYSGLISFRMDWLDLLSVQGTLKSLLQHHSSKASRFPWSFALQMVKYDLVSALDITKRNK